MPDETAPSTETQLTGHACIQSYLKEVEDLLLARFFLFDFSDDSARAVEKALFLADHLGLTQAVTCLNVLDIPPISRIGEMDIYNLAGKSVLEISKERYEHFLDQHHLDSDRLEPLFVESWDANLGDTIRSTAHETSTDLLVLGAHGHGAIQRFFVGSVTENLVDGDKDHLIWVVR